MECLSWHHGPLISLCVSLESSAPTLSTSPVPVPAAHHGGGGGSQSRHHLSATPRRFTRKASSSSPGEATGASDKLGPRGVVFPAGKSAILLHSSGLRDRSTQMSSSSSSSRICSGQDRRVMPTLAASSTGTLPMDAVYEILLRLPAKDLCRLRAVCQPWRALLSDPQFAAAHTRRHPEPLLMAAYMYNEENDSLVEIMDLSGHRLKKVRKKNGDWVVRVANDLVHVDNIASFNSRLLNPATGTAYCFPDRDGEGATYLFGKSAGKGEHKVVRRIEKVVSGRRSVHQVIEVFTLNDGSRAMWREKQPPPRRLARDKWTGVVIDGVAYILCFDAFYELSFCRRVNVKDMIITFDLETEEWGTILGPSISFLDHPFQALRLLIANTVPSRLTLADLNGSLAVVCVYGHDPSMDIWISTDIAKGHWVKQYSITFEQSDKISYVHPVLVLDDQRLVIYIQDKGLLQIYNPRRNTFTNVVELDHCLSVSLYTGNLLSLEH